MKIILTIFLRYIDINIYIYTCINNINNDVMSADILQDKDNFVSVVGNKSAVKC
jgi:hypothetical protein